MHAVGYLWLNVYGRYQRQCHVAQALHMAARRPTILILAEAQSLASPKDPPFQDYTRHVVLPAHGKTGAGLEVYVRTGTTTWASFMWVKEGANALLTEVLTPGGSITGWRPMPPKGTLALSHMFDGGRASGRRSTVSWTRGLSWL